MARIVIVCANVAFSHFVFLRIVWSIITMIVTFVFTIILAMVDSSQWIEAFFWVGIGVVFLCRLFL